MNAHSSAVDRNAIILIVAFSSGNRDSSARANIETIGICALGSSSLIINCDVGDSQVRAIVNAENLDWRVQNIDIFDCGRDQIMGIEELGLSLPAVGPLAVPPIGTVTIQVGA